MLSAEDIRGLVWRWKQEVARQEAAYDTQQTTARRQKAINVGLMAALLATLGLLSLILR